MIALSIALAVVGLAALWTARDVALRLHRGSEARNAMLVARAAEEGTKAACVETAAKVDALAAVVERVKSEHESIKARVTFGGGRR